MIAASKQFDSCSRKPSSYAPKNGNLLLNNMVVASNNLVVVFLEKRQLYKKTW
jgi:hypothetical protein